MRLILAALVLLIASAAHAQYPNYGYQPPRYGYDGGYGYEAPNWANGYGIPYRHISTRVGGVWMPPSAFYPRERFHYQSYRAPRAYGAYSW